MTPTVNYLSGTCLRLEVFGSEKQKLDIATCFFIENSRNDLFLVTNWHVVTGRRPQEPKLSMRMGAIPTDAIAWTHPRQNPNESSAYLNRTTEVHFRLNSEDGNSPLWKEHARFRNRADVVAIPIIDAQRMREDIVVHPINRYPNLEPRFQPSVMDDAYVVGFPWGLTGGGQLPIFKRGCIASEPSIGFGKLPRFLVDCRTSPSMSGSPVLGSRSGVWSPDGRPEDATIGIFENFIGVYSGRPEANDISPGSNKDFPELGIVWKREILEEIIEGGVDGTTLDEISGM